MGDDRFAYPARLWAVSLLNYGGQTPAALAIHLTDTCSPGCRRLFEAAGLPTQVVRPFDARHPHSNKLTQLESPLLQSADYVVLCDCDIVFCDDITPVVSGPALRARIAGYANLGMADWERLFSAAGLPLPVERARAAFDGCETIPAYCNGGLLVVPQPIFQRLRASWPRWDRWLLDHPDLMGRWQVFTDQAALALACAELGLEVNHLAVDYNCPIHPAHPVLAQLDLHPKVLHYHKRLAPDGRLLPSHIPAIDRAIAQVNELILADRREDFQNMPFWEFRP